MGRILNVPRYLSENNIDIVVVCTIEGFETFSLAMVEAWGLGIPTVATDAFGMKELVEKYLPEHMNSILFPIADHVALAERIIKIENDEKYFAQRDFLATFGREIVPETFKARRFGPVPTLTNKVIKRVEDSSDDICPDLLHFEKSIVIDNQIVKAVETPDMDYISAKERKCLDKWFEICKGKDALTELSSLSHDSAYLAVIDRMKTDPQQDVIARIDIAKAGGASEKTIDHIRENELIETAFA